MLAGEDHGLVWRTGRLCPVTAHLHSIELLKGS